MVNRTKIVVVSFPSLSQDTNSATIAQTNLFSISWYKYATASFHHHSFTTRMEDELKCDWPSSPHMTRLLPKVVYHQYNTIASTPTCS
jgi:hypothetical protein